MPENIEENIMAEMEWVEDERVFQAKDGNWYFYFDGVLKGPFGSEKEALDALDALLPSPPQLDDEENNGTRLKP